MSNNHNPLHKPPEQAFTLQKYLLLNTQHDALQSHLAALHSPPSSPTSSSPPSPPSNHSTTLDTIPSRPPMPQRRSSLPHSFRDTTSLAPRHSSTSSCASETCASDEALEEERKLTQVNQQIKSTLTELLNCESVKQDRLYSVWVQSRLMDAERELKEGRRHSVAAHGAGRRGSWEGVLEGLKV